MVRIILGFIVFLILGCAGVDQLIESGRYDQAIARGIQLLNKTPNDATTKHYVQKAYQLANEKDLERISIVKDLEESPENWELIYNYYLKIENRENLLTSNKIELPKQSTNYILEKDEAQFKACFGFADRAEQKMLAQNRASYKEAYFDWQKVRNLECTVGEIDSLQAICLENGKAIVVSNLTLQDGVQMPEQTEKKLKALPFDTNNDLGAWVVFKNNYDLKHPIHYTLEMQFNQTSVSRNQHTTSVKNLEKRIIDRYEYKTNSEGKKVKVPVYVTVKAKVTRHNLQKSASQGLLLTIVDNSDNRVIYQQQLEGIEQFSYYYGTFTGDTRALDSDASSLIKRKSRSFPSNSYMINRSTNALYQRVYSTIKSQKSLFR